MESTSLIVWGMLFGTIGLGFFTYGKRQRAVLPLVVGVALFVVPYVFSNVYLLILAGVLLIALPFLVRR